MLHNVQLSGLFQVRPHVLYLLMCGRMGTSLRKSARSMRIDIFRAVRSSDAFLKQLIGVTAGRSRFPPERNIIMELNDEKTQNHQLVPHKGFNLIGGTHDPDDVDQICNLDIRDSDVFVVTYPKSGTIWMQQILLLLEAKGDVNAISKLSNLSNADLIPWIELRGNRQAFMSALPPRQRVTHLQYQFLPRALSHKKGKVIYVARNPKDILVSYFYFHKVANMLETPKSFDDFFEKFLRGEVFGSSWFDHIKTWYSHKDEMNMLFITYEEMIQDLHSAVERISLFLGKELTAEQMASVVKHSTFSNMRRIPQASYEKVPGELLSHHLGRFMRKGTIGDWKNHFTVAQNQRFDEVFHKEMKDFPIPFIWDFKDLEKVLWCDGVMQLRS